MDLLDIDIIDPRDRLFDDILKNLACMSENFVREYELPERGVKVFENIGTGKTTQGQIISYSLCINEPIYPATEEEMLDVNRTHIPLVTIAKKFLKKLDKYMLEVTVSSSNLDRFPPGNDAEILPETKTDVQSSTRRVRFNLNSSTFLDWITSLARFGIENFMSAADVYGCCSRFKECSEAGKCIHPNRLYSTVCQYRHNLEHGKIFYANRSV